MDREAERKLEMPAHQFIDTAYARTVGGDDQVVVRKCRPSKWILVIMITRESHLRVR